MTKDRIASSNDFSRRNFLQVAGLGGMALAGIPALAACAGDATISGAAASAGAGPMLMDHLIANVAAFDSTDRAFKLSAKALQCAHTFTSHDGDMQKAFSQELLFPSLNVKGVHSYLVADAALDRYTKVLADAKIAHSNLSNRLPWFAPNDPKFKGYFIGNVGGPFAEEAYIITKLLLERGGGKGQAILLGGPKGGLSETARRFGVNLALKEFPDVKVVANAYTDWDTTKAQTQLAALLPTYPDVKFVVALNDGVALGALAALNAARNTTALVCGMDGDPAFLQRMQKEERIVATSAGLIAFSGVLAAVRLYDFLNGVKFHPLEVFIDTDSVIVDTPEAAAELHKITGPDAPLLWDATKMSRHLQGDKWILPHQCLVSNPTNFAWGDKPGTNPTPRPKNFSWPDPYQAALDKGDLDVVNADWQKRFVDPYASVRAKAKTKEGALGTFKRIGLI
ncbi:sugar ABC transporter substrate-binding protein [Streptomyces sp. NBC_01320]|uniref:sugar ABC transporter substrate-binding protein n=1 Tax=Streptomyces sp. NBC_01320 TaxID=2903824 RepID=UPI002E12937A|nr:substrate-binding domain-containing protein [Streptomyces sp. NBC_01320]